MNVRSTKSAVHAAAHMHGTTANAGTAQVASTHMHPTTAHVHAAATHVTAAHVHIAATHMHAAAAHMHPATTHMTAAHMHAAATHVAATASKVSTTASTMPAPATVSTTVCERQTGYCEDHRERETTIANESRYHHDLPCFSRVLCAGRPDDRKRTFEPLTNIRNRCFSQVAASRSQRPFSYKSLI